MTRLEAATADYLRFRDLKRQIATLNDYELALKFECSDRTIRKIRDGQPVRTISDEDRRLIEALIAEREAMREETRGKNLQSCCALHHVGKTTLINHLISIGEWEDGV